MKLLLALVPLLGLATVSGEATCEECSAVVSALAAELTSETSIAGQIEVLLAEVCPGSENPDRCMEGLPDFWTRSRGALPCTCQDSQSQDRPQQGAPRFARQWRSRW